MVEERLIRVYMYAFPRGAWGTRLTSMRFREVNSTPPIGVISMFHHKIKSTTRHPRPAKLACPFTKWNLWVRLEEQRSSLIGDPLDCKHLPNINQSLPLNNLNDHIMQPNTLHHKFFWMQFVARLFIKSQRASSSISPNIISTIIHGKLLRPF